MLSDRIAAVLTANTCEPHGYCHQIGSVKVVGAEPGGWRRWRMPRESTFTLNLLAIWPAVSWRTSFKILT